MTDEFLGKCIECKYCGISPANFGDVICRRYAPRPLISDKYIFWPIISEGDWCGEFIKRIGEIRE
jgi:hypothetical protein